MVSTRKRTVAAAVALTALVGSANAALGAGGSARSEGPDRTYGATENPFAEASADVQVVRTGEGSTLVTLHVRDVVAPEGTTFGAHVHQQPCGPDGLDAGGHYLHEGAVGTLEEREVWLDFTVNAGGTGHAEAARPWSLDESSPRSVILHALATAPNGAAGARLACIDLDGRS